MVSVLTAPLNLERACGEKRPGSSTEITSSTGTDALADLRKCAPGIDPNRTERLEALVTLRSRAVENAKATLINSNQHAPANHPCVQDLSETVRWAAEELNLPPGSVSLHVFKQYPAEPLAETEYATQLEAYLPRVFIIPDCGAIFINIAALEALSWSRQMINAALYHEVAHLKFIRERKIQVALEHDDPLKVESEGYEIEQHCDRLATLLSSKRKEAPTSIGRALAKLAEAEERVVKASSCDSNEMRGTAIPLLSTHPDTTRRIRENATIARHLPSTDLIRDSLLTPIEDRHLPNNRPLKEKGAATNSLGLCWEQVWKTGDEELPVEFAYLITQGQDMLRSEGVKAQSQLYSDWLAGFCAFLRTDDGPQFKHEYAQELRLADNSGPGAKEALGELLENINLARIFSNYDLCDAATVIDDLLPWDGGTVPPREVLDLLVERYAELRDEHSRPFDVLADLVQIGERGDRKFGVGSVFCSTQILRLCAEVAHNGSETEQRNLVTLVDRNPSLQAALTRVSKAKKLREGVPNLESLDKLLLAHSKTMFIKVGQTSLLYQSLESHTLESWIDGSSLSWEGSKTSICIRRQPGADVTIERKALRDGRNYELVTVGDTPIGDVERRLLRQHLTGSLDQQLHATSARLNLSDKDRQEARTAQLPAITNTIRVIEDVSASLQKLVPTTIEEKRTYMRELLAAQFEEARLNRTHRIQKDIFSLSSDDVVDARLHLSLEFRIRIEGRQAVYKDLVGLNRGSFSQARYARGEERSPEHLQIERLWHDLYNAEYASMSVGLDKARFLVESYPIKTRCRDQLICESLELPPLRYLDDMRVLSEVILGETSIDKLMLLRDSLHCQELAQVTEVRLFELFENSPTEFLRHSVIASSLPNLLRPLPEVLQQLVSSDEKLLGVLVCFAYASRERDRHLAEFRDGANSRDQKEALGALFSDPNLASTQGAVLFQRRQDADTVFASMTGLEPYDKAQSLLYFMGRRGFFSPLQQAVESQTTACVGDCDTPLISRRASDWVEMPDALIRAQKALGIAISTAENLKAGLLNERTLTDLLHESLYGRNGIAGEPVMLARFFKLTGLTLIEQNPQLAALEAQQQRKLAELLGFVFAHCPQDRLPSVILKVWEASKSNNNDTPALVATIFSKLGPAFVKFGQRLAQLDIDPEYRRAFRKLCSENAQVDTSFIYHNLGIICPAGTFDEACSGRKIAEGSMAATFRGTISDSKKTVCIKMIHPAICGDIDQDVGYIRKIVEYMNREQTFPGLMIPANTPEIVRQQLTEQVDTRLEMARTEHLRRALKAPESGLVTFVVPEVLQDVSGEGALVYEFLPSYELDREEITSQGFDARAVLHEVGLEILRMLVEESHYQSDVNLGNFGVVKDPESGAIVHTGDQRPTVVWYDAGAVQEIDPNDQKLLLQIVLAAAKDPAEIPGLVSELVNAEGNRAEDVHTICQEFGTRLKANGDLSVARLKEQLQEFIDVLAEAGFAVQDKWLVIANTLSMAAPFLSGVDEKRLTDLFGKAMLKHGLLSRTQLLAMRFASFWK